MIIFYTKDWYYNHYQFYEIVYDKFFCRVILDLNTHKRNFHILEVVNVINWNNF